MLETFFRKMPLMASNPHDFSLPALAILLLRLKLARLCLRLSRFFGRLTVLDRIARWLVEGAIQAANKRSS